MTELCFQKLHPLARLPSRQTPGSIGLDIHAFILQTEGRPSKTRIAPRETRNISAGLLIRSDTPVFVCSRSGLAARGVFVANQPGIIDPDYRGELRVLLHNSSWEEHWVSHEDRIAQLIVITCSVVEPIEVNDIPADTVRGRRGFGSTGQ